jgi:hypothetical protein
MGELLNAEKRATEYALVESQRPNYTIRFPKVDAYHVGQFIQLWQVATAYAGLMLNVDAYDQPAVELGKQATCSGSWASQECVNNSSSAARTASFRRSAVVCGFRREFFTIVFLSVSRCFGRGGVGAAGSGVDAKCGRRMRHGRLWRAGLVGRRAPPAPGVGAVDNLPR